MAQTSFFEPSHSIFANNDRPQLFYLHREGNTSLKTTHTLQSQKETAELIIIEKGSGRYMVNNQVYNIAQGDILLLNAGVLHGLCPNKTSQLETCRLGIKRLHLRGLATGQFINENITPVLSAGNLFASIQQFIDLFDSIMHEPDNKTPNEAQDNLLAALLVTIVRLINSDSQPNDSIPGYSLGLHIKEYIDTHYLEDLRLNDIAAALHINPYYLSHTFKKVVGYSPIQYMIRRRIGESQNLLVNTNYTITDIALRCGYNNSNYFQSVFNSIVGMSPGRYRKAWRQ